MKVEFGPISAAEIFIVDATMLDGVLSARSWRRK